METASALAPARRSCSTSMRSDTRHPSVVPSEMSTTSGLATLDRLLDCAEVAVHHPLAREALTLAQAGRRPHRGGAGRISRELEDRLREGAEVAGRDEEA